MVGDVGGAGQQHVDLDEVAKGGAGLVQHALDVGDDIAELRLEAVGQRAVLVEAGNAGDEQQVAGAGGERQRRGFDARRRREVLYGGHRDSFSPW